ncbi:hypothetical protein AVEN_250869-1 [Araneus ventricosus]|uniref:Uncharacterized protein n=1 Tax=Araneus ventricosus TaxID=182803 RepID=A0A4Y2IN19_ARAVE|nr:hypothetical protein AVEN_250869-1 [Araneus ventricosus]
MLSRSTGEMAIPEDSPRGKVQRSFTSAPTSCSPSHRGGPRLLSTPRGQTIDPTVLHASSEAEINCVPRDNPSPPPQSSFALLQMRKKNKKVKGGGERMLMSSKNNDRRVNGTPMSVCQCVWGRGDLTDDYVNQ